MKGSYLASSAYEDGSVCNGPMATAVPPKSSWDTSKLVSGKSSNSEKSVGRALLSSAISNIGDVDYNM